MSFLYTGALIKFYNKSWSHLPCYVMISPALHTPTLEELPMHIQTPQLHAPPWSTTNSYIHTHTQTHTHLAKWSIMCMASPCVCVWAFVIWIFSTLITRVRPSCLYVCMYECTLELAGFPYSHRSIPACRQILNQREKCPTMFVNVDYIHVHNHADTVIDIVLIQLGNVDLP